MQARYYDPLLARFYSNDPIGFRDIHSFNRYAYANNNPYKYIDPDGRVTTDAQQLRNNGVNNAGVASAMAAQGEVIAETTGINDAIDAVQNLTNGDVLGAASSVAMAVVKPLKVATKASKLQQQIKKGQAPKGIKRADSAEQSVPDSQDHVHFDDGTSLNVDGTVHDKKGGIPKPNNKQKKFLKKENWPTEAKKD
jgi:uncharacterized protein RhaS with RHS repeats